MQIVKISEVKPNPKNPRVIKDGKFQKLVKSIQEFPDMLNKRPLIVFTDVDNKYVVLGGNMRLKALNELKFKEIPVIIADEWTEEQKAEFLIKDNVGFGEWDWDSLANEWDTEKIQDWGLDLPVDLSVIELEAEEDDFSVPEGGIETDIVLGDLFEIGEHRLLCGNSTDSDQVAKLMNGEKADMVFTDPPYNVNYEGGSKKREKIENDSINNFYQFLYDIYTNCFIIMKEGSPIYVAHSELERANFTTSFIDAGFKLSSVIIWAKNNSTFSMNKDYKWKHEPIIYGWKHGKQRIWKAGNTEDTLWSINRPSRSEEHPTMKPIELCEKAIKNSSIQKSLIVDVFLGSGSTMVASHQLKRKCYGMELDPKYCQVIIDRMKKLDPSLVIKKNGVELK
jgi:DNA modification methylase